MNTVSIRNLILMHFSELAMAPSAGMLAALVVVVVVGTVHGQGELWGEAKEMIR